MTTGWESMSTMSYHGSQLSSTPPLALFLSSFPSSSSWCHLLNPLSSYSIPLNKLSPKTKDGTATLRSGLLRLINSFLAWCRIPSLLKKKLLKIHFTAMFRSDKAWNGKYLTVHCVYSSAAHKLLSVAFHLVRTFSACIQQSCIS